MKAHYHVIDLVRFIAALGVAGFHLAYLPWAEGEGGRELLRVALPGQPPPVPWMWFGWIGVQIFFVISGFVIAYSASASTARRFFDGRLLRLYPTAWIAATISFVLLVAINGYSNGALLTYLSTMVLNPRGPWLSYVYWTLGVEIMFYAVTFVWVFAARLPVVRLGMALALYSAVYNILLAYGHYAKPDLQLAPFFVERLGLLRYGCFFAFGMLLQNRLATWPWRLCTAAAILGCILEVVVKTDEFLRSHPHGAVPGWGGTESIVPLLAWVLCCLLIAGAGSLNRFIREEHHGIVRFVGLLTYPLYLLHQDIGAFVSGAFQKLGVADLPAAILGIAGAILMSMVLVAKLEPPVRHAFASLLRRVPGSRPAARSS